MISLPNITLAIVASTHIPESKEAIQQSQKGIKFGDVVELYDQNLKSSDEYSKFILYKLNDYIRTDYCLLIQWDGYVLRPEKWSDEFYSYDFIGSPWPEGSQPERVGNGGFSFRSKKLLNAFNELGLEFTDKGTGFFHEDGQICVYYRRELEDYGIKFAPVEIASRFGKELECHDSVKEPFGFHRYK